ncbi:MULTISPECIES: acetyl-CoA carboxylase biotin carboxylase subunit family protein [unclassified Nocardia]|uniref:ATP-grasp domain-containing protein n=1 Tax=unclassified Nocardia TaxID=2637762 RepID=UPI001CE3BB52|nr:MULTISPECIES: ATP-grasp domain-containing protein [unclassified Nocardia]
MELGEVAHSLDDAPADGRPLLILVNSGRNAAYRGWTLRSLAERFRLWLFSIRPASWERPYVVGQTLVDVLDVEAAVDAAHRLRASYPVSGVLCYDEMRITAAATLAERLGVPTSSADSVRACHDKAMLRHSAGGVASIPVDDVAAASAAAERIGYPVIVKPRTLAASEGVVRVDHADRIADAFGFAAAAYGNFGATAGHGGVLVEEYLDGPEITVDAVVWRGEVVPAFISHKRQDLAPTFEETGHLVVAEDPLLADPDILRIVQQAHTAAGFEHGVTHTEVRLTESGPKLIELNARLGGDLITYVGLLATGIDLALAAGQLAVGEAPDIRPRRRAAAAVRFFYPPYDLIVDDIRVHTQLLPKRTWSVTPLAEPGTELRRPPRAFVKGRAAMGFVIATDADGCDEALRDMSAAIEIKGRPIS